MANNKKLAVFGGTGKKSGLAFTKLLASNILTIKDIFPNGIVFIARESSNTNKIEELFENVDIRKGRIKDDSFLDDCLKNVDTVVNIVGVYKSLNIVNSAIRCNVRRLILVHTTGIYSKYKEAGQFYREVEEQVYKLCKDHNIILNIIRPTMIYGNIYDNNIIHFVKMVDKLPFVPLVNGGMYKLQPVNYNDLASSYYSILISEDKTKDKEYIISGKNPMYLKEMLEIIGKEINKKVRFINIPFKFAYFCANILYIVSFKKKDFREKVQRLCEDRNYSHDLAKNDFDYNPMSFEDGIKNEIKEYLEKK